MMRARFAWPSSLSLLLALGCQGSVMVDPGSSHGGGGGAASSTSSASSGSGGAAIDAGPLICQDPPAPLPDGSLGPESCNCPCALEAPANLTMLAQAAIAAHQSKGALCTSSDWPVPAVPAPKCFQPNPNAHADFFTGTADGGWLCLGVGSALTKPIHCSYHYQAGSGYFAPALGGPDPGPMGFEVAALGDFDGDGVYSTFTIAGTLDATTGQFTLSPTFEHNPEE